MHLCKVADIALKKPTGISELRALFATQIQEAWKCKKV